MTLTSLLPTLRPAHRAAVDPPTRLVLTDPLHSEAAAGALAGGAVVGHGFAGLYALTSRSDPATVRRVNRMKGRPGGQVASVTTAPSRIPQVWDWARLPGALTRRSVLGVVDALLALGPFGFRGPAADHVPDHLTAGQHGVRTVQLIVPGYACPANDFLGRAIEACDDDLLAITSADRSRPANGLSDSPPHWRADGLHADFGDEPDFLLLEHDDEAEARRRWPRHLPMSTSVLGFHRLGVDRRRPALVLERHGSLSVGSISAVLDRLGFSLVLAPRGPPATLDAGVPGREVSTAGSAHQLGRFLLRWSFRTAPHHRWLERQRIHTPPVPATTSAWPPVCATAGRPWPCCPSRGPCGQGLSAPRDRRTRCRTGRHPARAPARSAPRSTGRSDSRC